MAEQPAPNTEQKKPEEFPAPGLPVVFADSVMSITHNPAVVKFYLARHDPSIFATGGYNTQHFAQVVMPTPQFVQTILFLNLAVQNMIKDGTISQTDYDSWKKTVEAPQR